MFMSKGSSVGSGSTLVQAFRCRSVFVKWRELAYQKWKLLADIYPSKKPGDHVRLPVSITKNYIDDGPVLS